MWRLEEAQKAQDRRERSVESKGLQTIEPSKIMIPTKTIKACFKLPPSRHLFLLDRRRRRRRHWQA